MPDDADHECASIRACVYFSTRKPGYQQGLCRFATASICMGGSVLQRDAKFRMSRSIDAHADADLRADTDAYCVEHWREHWRAHDVAACHADVVADADGFHFWRRERAQPE